MTDLMDRLEPRHFATVARLVLPAPVSSWIESGGGPPSDNEAAFGRYRVVPRVLRDVTAVRVATTLQGTEVAAPIGIAPVGLQRAIHPDGELATASGAAREGAVMIVPVNATTPVADIARAEPDATLWFQLYNWRDRDALARAVADAEAAGCRAIVPLVNTPLPVAHVPASIGFRLPPGLELAHGAAGQDLDGSLDWSWVEWLVGLTSLPVVAKGVLHPDDARRAVDAGCRGIIASNHGGRQVPRSVATLTALPALAAAVGERIEVYLDGGVRTGADVLIALALGARAVFVARPMCWGLAVGGAAGVARVLSSMREELASDLGMCGIADIGDIPADLVVRDDPSWAGQAGRG